LVLSDGSYAVFAKFNGAADGLEQFETEMAGLRLLAERAAVLTPTPIGVIPVVGGSILVLEAVTAVDRAPRDWRLIGQTLAHIHRVKSDRFGLDMHGFFGPLRQDNTPMDDWPSFFAERRLRPGLRLAIESGHPPGELIRPIEALIARVPELCGPEITPTLLHGDAQQNNFISTASVLARRTALGAVVIDPAVYYGHPEMDLAYVDYFQSVPDDLLDGYRDEHRIDPGFRDRRDLWRVWGYLATVTVEGAGHLGRLHDAVRRYLRCIHLPRMT
jgi:protein-ribulosamine 3-kinase